MKRFVKYGSVVVLAIVVLLVAVYFIFPEAAFKLAKDAQRRSADLVRKEIQVDDHRIVFLEGGKGETIILLHGFGGYKDQWTAFAKYMKGYHLVIPDLPGFGESSQVPTANYSVDSQVGRIERFAEVLKLHTFHLAGNSMGGALSATYGAKYPEKVLTLALLDTSGAPSKNKSDLVVQLEQGNNLLLANNTEDVEKLMALAYFKPPKIPTAFRKILIADWIAHTKFNNKIWNECQPIYCSLEPILPLIQAPVLIVWGDQDKVLDVGGVAFLEKNLKNYRTAIMKDTGHCPMIERPEETAITYMSFLKEKK